MFAMPHCLAFFSLHGWDMLGMFLETHSRVARLSDRAWTAVAIASGATSARGSLERFWCCHGGVLAEMRHAARAVEMNRSDARKSAKTLLKTRVFRGVISVPDVHLDYRRPIPRVCDMAVFMIVIHAHHCNPLT